MTKRIKSRQRKPAGVVTKTGVEVTECYCRKCMKMKKPTLFYSAVDFDLDANGKFSVCTACINFEKACEGNNRLGCKEVRILEGSGY